jgi:hypothetical protein
MKSSKLRFFQLTNQRFCIIFAVLLSLLADTQVRCWQPPNCPSSSEAVSRRTLLNFGAVGVATTTLIPSKKVWAGIDVSSLRVEGQQTRSVGAPLSASTQSNPQGDKVQTIELAGISYTPAAMILQIAEQTASMEGMMRASVKDIQAGKSTRERVELGSESQGPGVVRRQDLNQSIKVMVTNSKLALISPKATTELEGIPVFLNQNSNSNTDMSLMEYQIVASKYNSAREELRVAFEVLPTKDQQEGQQIVRKLRAQDMERRRQ